MHTTEVDKKSGLVYRPETKDLLVIREIPSYFHNKKKENYFDFKDKSIMDIGANIGGFTCFVADEAKRVVCFEPEPGNFEILKINIGKKNKEDKISAFQSAVIGNESDNVDFYINLNSENRGLNSIRSKRGYDKISVPAENFSKIIEENKPNIIKIDIEGGEYDLMYSIIKIDSCVECILLEFHFLKKDDREKYKFCMDLLSKNKFNAVKTPVDTGKNFATVGVFVR